MSDWRQLSPEEVTERIRREGWRVNHHIVAQWVKPHAGREPGGELTLFENGAVQLDGTAPVELVAHLLAAWHGHMKGKIA